MRTAELARLAAFLEASPGDDEAQRSEPEIQSTQVPRLTNSHVTRSERIAAITSQLEASCEAIAAPCDYADGMEEEEAIVSEVSSLERMYRTGLLKQRARNYKAPSTLERQIGSDSSRRFCLSFRPTTAGAHKPYFEADVRPTQPVSIMSDEETHTQGRKNWDAGVDHGPLRMAERRSARQQEIRAQSARRFMLQERVPPFCLPLPKNACALGGPDPLASSGIGGAGVGGWDGKEELGREDLGRVAWAKGVVVNQGGMWRHRGTALHPTAEAHRNPCARGMAPDTEWHVE